MSDSVRTALLEPVATAAEPGRVRRLMILARPYARRIAGAVGLSLLSTGAYLATPLGYRALLDTVFQGGTGATLERVAMALAALYVLRAGLSMTGSYVLRQTGDRVVTDLRKQVYGHLQRLGLAYFSKQRVGDLTSRLTSDVASVRAAVTEGVVSVVVQTAKFAGSVGVMMALNWRLGLLVLLTAPIASGIARAFSGTFRGLARSVQDDLAASTAVAEETLSSVRAVKAFAREGYETERYGAAVEALYEKSRRSAAANAAFASALELLFSLALVGVLWYGGREVLAGRLTPGALVAFLFYAQFISQSITGLGQVYALVTTASGASERIFELLATTPEGASSHRKTPLRNMRGEVRLEHVCFAYDSEQVLRDVSFGVGPGETIALVGPSGAGKSTLMNLLPRFFDPTSGAVLVDGRDLRSLELQALRERVAVVPQEVYLFAGSVRDNIRYGRLDATDAEIEAAARAANAHDFIRELPGRYDAQIGERGVRLSGGERQRISIARALLKRGRILLLDEPTSAMDSVSEALVHEALARGLGDRTTFITAHRLSTTRAADRILVLDRGQIVEAGTHGELFARGGLYRTLAEHQLLQPDIAARTESLRAG